MTFSSLLLVPLLTVVVVVVVVDGRVHTSETPLANTEGNGCCSRNYKICQSTSTATRQQTDSSVTTADVLSESNTWFCNELDPSTLEPMHCGQTGGCLDLVWLPDNVFDARCVPYRSGPCTPNRSEKACCRVDGLEERGLGQHQLQCDEATLTCLLPEEIQSRSVVTLVLDSKLNPANEGWTPSTSRTKAKGCCSHDHKTCDTTGYCNWKERCGSVRLGDGNEEQPEQIVITEEVSADNPGRQLAQQPPAANNKISFKDDHCKDYIWLGDLGRAFEEGDDDTGRNTIISGTNPNDLPAELVKLLPPPEQEGIKCFAREADACHADAECCPGLYCHKEKGTAGYNHCAWVRPAGVV